jgi:hypothetical protein
MALNIGRNRNSGSSESFFISPLRYSAVDDTWSTYSPRDYDTVVVDPDWNAIADLGHIKTGFMKFATDEIPDFIWDNPDGTPQPRPSKDYRRGFALRPYRPEHLFGLRELVSSSLGLGDAVVEIHNQYVAAPEAARGLLPTTQVTGPPGDYWEPRLEVISWAPRPRELLIPPSAPIKPASVAVIPGLVKSDLDDTIPF